MLSDKYYKNFKEIGENFKRKFIILFIILLNLLYYYTFKRKKKKKNRTAEPLSNLICPSVLL